MMDMHTPKHELVERVKALEAENEKLKHMLMSDNRNYDTAADISGVRAGEDQNVVAYTLNALAASTLQEASTGKKFFLMAGDTLNITIPVRIV